MGVGAFSVHEPKAVNVIQVFIFLFVSIY